MDYFKTLRELIESCPEPKIVICGNSGSGKSTLGKLISKAFHLKHIEIDHLRWLPGWKLRSSDEFRKLLNAELQNSSWVIDDAGVNLVINLSQQATIVIWLDVSMWGSLFRIMRRSLLRRTAMHASPIGPERLSEIWKLWKYILLYNKERRPVLKNNIGTHPALIHIQNWSEVVRFMDSFNKG